MAIDDYTKTLLHFDGVNGSTSFVDETGKVWTASGNAQISTAQSVFGGASGLFDGDGDYISTPDSDDWRLDGGSNSNEWTVDFRVRFSSTSGDRILIGQGTDNSNRWRLTKSTDNYLSFRQTVSGTINIQIDNSWSPSANVWYHLALVKQGATGYKMFVEGTQLGSTQTDTTVLSNFAASLTVGITTGSSSYFAGYMDELRISKGIARWTSNSPAGRGLWR
jgi:hypothetical protein